MQSALKIACWNVAWHGPRSRAGKAIIEKLLDHSPDLICCPEAPDNFLLEGWHGAFSDPDYGYSSAIGRRKVTLWSRQPWREIDMRGSTSLPAGRFVAATTATSLGDVRIVGICIPWRMAHVATGNRNRTAWQDHRAYLEGFHDAVGSCATPRIVVGDFNQRIPPAREPKDVSEKLRHALNDFRIWTAGEVPGLAVQPVCHIGGSQHFDLIAIRGISRATDGSSLSDHDGLIAEVTLR